MKRFLMLAGVAGLVVGACGSGDSAVSPVSIDPAAIGTSTTSAPDVTTTAAPPTTTAERPPPATTRPANTTTPASTAPPTSRPVPSTTEPTVVLDDGPIAYLSNFEIWLMDADGANQRSLPIDITIDGGPVWSPDGTMIAFTGFDPDVPAPEGVVPDIWVVDADGNGLRNVTTLPGPHHALSPSWSPDGSRLAYVTTEWDIWIVNADGTGNHRITNDVALQESVDWSPDGSLLVYNEHQIVDHLLTGTNEIWTIEPDGNGPTRLTAPGHRSGPVWSPSGSAIAFVTYVVPQHPARDYSDIWIMNADGSDQRNLTDDPTRFDRSPGWSLDGTRVVFDSAGPLGPYIDEASGEQMCCAHDPPAHIYVMPSNGGPTTPLTFGDRTEQSPSWQPLPAG